MAISAISPALADDGVAQAMLPGRTPAEVISTLTSACITGKYLVEESAASSLLCSHEMTGLRAAIGQALIGNVYSTTPVEKVRFVAVAVGNDTQLQAQHWMETVMAFGQKRTVPLSGKKMQLQLDMMVANMKPQEAPPPPLHRVPIPMTDLVPPGADHPKPRAARPGTTNMSPSELRLKESGPPSP